MKSFANHVWKTLTLILAIIVIVLLFRSKPDIVRPNIVSVPTSPIQSSISSYVPIIINNSTHNTIHDSIYKPIYIPPHIDTNSIIMDYFRKRFYDDIIVNDSNLYFELKDSVHRNRIVWRKPFYKVFPHVYKQFVYEASTRKVFLGIGAYNFPNHFGITGGFAYEDKKGKLFNVDYDPFGKVGIASIKWKISLRNIFKKKDKRNVQRTTNK